MDTCKVYKQIIVFFAGASHRVQRETYRGGGGDTCRRPGSSVSKPPFKMYTKCSRFTCYEQEVEEVIDDLEDQERLQGNEDVASNARISVWLSKGNSVFQVMK